MTYPVLYFHHTLPPFELIALTYLLIMNVIQHNIHAYIHSLRVAFRVSFVMIPDRHPSPSVALLPQCLAIASCPSSHVVYIRLTPHPKASSSAPLIMTTFCRMLAHAKSDDCMIQDHITVGGDVQVLCVVLVNARTV